MRPFYFGTSSRPLFGVYHPPATPPGPRGGVLLCYPFGREYLRAHRAVRELANELGREGFHGLRFDYYGCGDSGGEGVDGSIVEWVANVSDALEELEEASLRSDLSAVGLRLGAALAFLAASSGRARPFRRLVLWDPIVSGSRYLEELDSLQEEWSRAHPAVASKAPADGAEENLGFPLTPALRDTITGIDLRKIEKVPAESVLVMTSKEDADADELAETLGRRGARVTRESISGAKFWLRQEGIDHAVVPTETVRSIASWFANGAR
ncbi:MAG: serine aminopeptidase domain-containing protein [Vicinamibacteria bacterium]